MWKILVLLFIAVSPLVADEVESLTYTIITKGDTVGSIKMKKYTSKDTLIYEYLSDATVKFFGTHHVVSKKICKYLGGKMIYAYTHTTENGSTKDHVVLKWTGKQYNVHETGSDFTQSEPVYFSTIRMFFEEPSTSVKSIFAEVKLDFQELSKIDANTYEANGGWGKGGKYYYKDGKLVKALIFSPLIDFELHRM